MSARNQTMWSKREWFTSYFQWADRDPEDAHADATDGFSERFVWNGIHSAANEEPYFYQVTPWVDDRVSAEDVARATDLLDRVGISRWWDTPIDRADQQAVIYPRYPTEQFPPRGNPDEEVREWMIDAKTLDGEGVWWSPPHGPGIVMTSRSLPFAPAVFLVGEEDEFGFKTADVYTASHIPPDARVYEVASGNDWLRLLELAPADVTVSRRATWGKFDPTARWFLPDWVEVSKSYDAVHLTVNAYLDLSAVPQECPGGFTMIVGWGPDETCWLKAPAVTWSTPRHVARHGEVSWS